MHNTIIDLNYVKKEQNALLEHLKSIEGINYQDDKFNIPKWLVLALLSELMEVLNETKIHKWWDRAQVNKDKLKEELADMLAHLGNLANILDVDLIATVEEIQTETLESQFVFLTYKITTLTWNRTFGKGKLDKILSKFIQLIYSLGFEVSEIEEAYKEKMQHNYTRFRR